MKQYFISDIVKIKQEFNAINEKVNDMTTPVCEPMNLSQLRCLHKRYLDDYAAKFKLNEKDKKGVFILIVCALNIPNVFLGRFMTGGLRRRLSTLLGIKPTKVSIYLRNYIDFYNLYKSTRNIVDYIYKDIMASFESHVSP